LRINLLKSFGRDILATIFGSLFSNQRLAAKGAALALRASQKVDREMVNIHKPDRSERRNQIMEYLS